MSEDRQIVVPQAFMAIYISPGASRPSVDRQTLEARWDLCEDLAQTLLLQAVQMIRSMGITRDDVLERVGQGVHDESSGLLPGEGHWVLGRLSELMDEHYL